MRLQFHNLKASAYWRRFNRLIPAGIAFWKLAG
jgi:hypothetical protein